jgi:transposase-like protein
MSELVGQGSKYTDEERREAAVQYAVTGSVSATSRAMDIPRRTISDWTRTDWWDEVVAEVRQLKADEHIARYQALTDKALRVAEEAIDRLDPSSISASDIKALIVSGATSTDKARLLMNQPTSVKSDSSSTDMLRLKFEYIARHSVWNPEKQRYEIQEPIDGECEEMG